MAESNQSPTGKVLLPEQAAAAALDAVHDGRVVQLEVTERQRFN